MRSRLRATTLLKNCFKYLTKLVTLVTFHPFYIHNPLYQYGFHVHHLTMPIALILFPPAAGPAGFTLQLPLALDA
jgi:hypothetical protein